MPLIAGLDPGPVQSAICMLGRGAIATQISARTLPNAEMLKYVASIPKQVPVAIEMIASYGMPVGREVFETCVWIGRFIGALGREPILVYRKDVKLHLCGSMKAKDSNIRQALLDFYGPQGVKKAPGVTYGIKKDEWAALAVAHTALGSSQQQLAIGGKGK